MLNSGITRCLLVFLLSIPESDKPVIVVPSTVKSLMFHSRFVSPEPLVTTNFCTYDFCDAVSFPV
ncbi:hypothetical protein [Clostridium cadaveris]|uniref:hypothetical protein n=1 Tax=Clostridium cadaveris TaxID=1529 RepID=UPI0025A45E77|nr:hypothetical protein [Clostridium cadaveris]MDM8311434.1 hypothetical protein [Clostridium cadaveris]